MKSFFGLILIFAFWSCSRIKNQESVFFMRQMKTTFVCDTIFDISLRDNMRILRVYEETDGSKIEKNGKEYFRFRASLSKDSPWMLLTFEKNRVYLIPEDALVHPERYEEEMLIDFGATRNGETWHLHQGGILGNSILRLDSVFNEDGTHYLSSKNIYDIADYDQVLKLAISKGQGIKELTISSLGDTVICRCHEP